MTSPRHVHSVGANENCIAGVGRSFRLVVHQSDVSVDVSIHILWGTELKPVSPSDTGEHLPLGLCDAGFIGENEILG